nr:MerR family transcriptional regulator [Clostridium aromativorans]
MEEVALKTNLTKRTLRYYEDMKLVIPKRSNCGYRLYTEEDIMKIERIKDLKNTLGFSLKDIKNFMMIKKSVSEMLENDSSKDTDEIQKYIKKIKTQISSIENKEKSLERIKKRCCDLLENLQKLDSSTYNV